MSELDDLRAEVASLRTDLDRAGPAIGLLEDRNAIERLQYACGYFIDNRMFREMADLFGGNMGCALPRARLT